jgi:glycine dehydrogenase subunit 1
MTAHDVAAIESGQRRAEGAGKGRREVDDAFVHPYIPNSVPAIKRQMLEDAGVGGIEEILAQIPSDLRIQGLMDLPEPLTSEYDLRRHVEGLLARNTATDEHLSFLGGGCARHYVPALCDEVVSRGEFLTAYSGGNYSDLGKHQARFEYNSLMAELLDYDVCVEPFYDWGGAAGFALRMS